MAGATLTDMFDGLLARALKQETDLGKILDPLADKIAIAIVSILLMLKGALPLWFVSLAIVRDLAILSGGLYVRKKNRTILQSNTMGKWTVTVVALLLIVSAIDLAVLHDAKNMLLAASAVMLVASFVAYTRRFIRTTSAEG